MATILEFRCPGGKPGGANAGAIIANARMAEIIIFPGVRIERAPGSDAGGVTSTTTGGTAGGSARHD